MNPNELFADLPEDTSSHLPAQPAIRKGSPRVLLPEREQVEMIAASLETLLPPDHRVRLVWAFVAKLDLSKLYAKIDSVEHVAGRPAIDPRILVALWLHATIEAVGSARQLARLCEEHLAYRWLCGGVSVNYHTLSDFRTADVEILDELLTGSVAVLMTQGLVELDRVAQDGVRVRASAGTGSFRRRARLEENLSIAREHVATLRQELEQDPAAASRRQQAARQRATRERREKLEAAIVQLAEVESKRPDEKKKESRASTTDPEARVMKMGDGGWRPAYNLEYATDTATRVIVGVDVTNLSSDRGRMEPMREQIKRRHDKTPPEHLVDGGFIKLEELDRLGKSGCLVYAPPPQPHTKDRSPYDPLDKDTAAVAAWRARMATSAAKQIYKQRASTAEWVNAQARNRGLVRLLVRGLRKVKAIALWHALAHNLVRSHALQTLRIAQTA